MNRTFKEKLKNVIIGVLSVTTIGAIAACFVIDGQTESTALKPLNYTIAGIDENGEVNKASHSSLVSNKVSATGLSIEYTRNATATATVHWYNSEEAYISSTIVGLEDTTLETPETAEYARVEIVPNEDNYISLFEQAEYASQVTVTVNK